MGLDKNNPIIIHYLYDVPTSRDYEIGIRSSTPSKRLEENQALLRLRRVPLRWRW